MIYNLNGKLTYVEPTFIVIECGGVGFKCFASTTTITSISTVGNNVNVLTYMSVKEDSIDLYGFATQDELNALRLVMVVRGRGRGSKGCYGYTQCFTAGQIIRSCQQR